MIGKQKIKREGKAEEKARTIAIIEKVIEGVGVAIVGKLVAGGRKFLKALKGNGIEIAAEFGVVGENHSAASDEGVDERLLSHLRKEFRLTDLSSVSSSSPLSTASSFSVLTHSLTHCFCFSEGKRQKSVGFERRRVRHKFYI